MKKLAIIMMTLSVLGSIGGAMLPAMALEGDVTGLGESVAGVDGVPSSWEESFTTEANVVNKALRFPYLYPLHDYLTVELIPSETRALKRLLLVYYDYEAGVTEAEADAGLATLGEDTADWAVVLADEEYRFGMETHPLLNMSGFEVVVEGKFTDNKRDLLYYAAEFGEPKLMEDGSTSWENTVWTRGKYDYRTCIHGEDFDPNLPNYVGIPTCFAREDGQGKILVTATHGGEISDNVLSWEEEWRQIQAERLWGVVEEMSGWDDEWLEIDVKKALAELGRLERTLVVSIGVEDLAVVEGALTEQLEGWLDDKNETVGDKTEIVGDELEVGTEGKTTTVAVSIEGVANQGKIENEEGTEPISTDSEVENMKSDQVLEVPTLGGEAKSSFRWLLGLGWIVCAGIMVSCLILGYRRKKDTE